DLKLQQRVVRIDPIEQTVTTDKGNLFSYGSLVWAAGGTPKSIPLPHISPDRVFTIRTLADIDRLNAKLSHIENIAIIGGGYIGLEAAAVFRKLGKGVELVEVAPRLLSRVAAAEMSDFLIKVQEDHGVRFHLGMSVQDITDGAPLTLHLNTQTSIDADIVIIGIGIEPNITPLAEAGAEIGNGIHVNAFCQSSLPNIYAIGDCVSFKSPYANDHWVRLESVQNANDQAKVVIHHILGREKAYTAVPWFWSDQYDLKLQTIGLTHGYDHVILRGDPQTNSFSLVYLRENLVCAIDSINRPLDFAQGRLLLGKAIDQKDPRLKEISIPFKELLDHP
ncbi:MAG: FAD-dependent oxidoreductase, partial [Pseudomonadota bacterium]